MSGSATFDPALVLSTILRRNAALMGTAHGFVALVNHDCTCLTVEYAMGLAENYVGRQLCDHDGVAWQVFTTGAPCAIHHYPTWEKRFRGVLPRNQEQVGSVAGVPALVGGVVYAVLVFIFEAEEFPADTDVPAWLADVMESASMVMSQLESISGREEQPGVPPFDAGVIPTDLRSRPLPPDSAGMDVPPAY